MLLPDIFGLSRKACFGNSVISKQNQNYCSCRKSCLQHLKRRASLQDQYLSKYESSCQKKQRSFNRLFLLHNQDFFQTSCSGK